MMRTAATCPFLLKALYVLFLGPLVGMASGLPRPDTTGPYRQWGVSVHAGLSVPDQVVPTTGKAPQGAEITYSWLPLSQRAWEQCHCYAKVGVYANYYAFRNPVALGRTVGAGLFFEPLIRPHWRTYYSVRFSAGLTYLTRVYDPETNPTNRYVSLPVSSQIGVGLNLHHRLTNRVHLKLSGYYNHISNAGTRQPNQGLNLPSLGAGVVYLTRPVAYPVSQAWRPTRWSRPWFGRVLLLGSVRVLPRTNQYREMVLPMFGVNAVGGYRLGASHVLSGGVEWTDDRYFKEQIRRWRYADQRYRQGSLLAGYEFWHGRYIFTAHMAWNVIRPQPYKPATYQKYGLLYRFSNGFTLGLNVKAYGDNTKGFQAVGGMTF